MHVKAITVAITAMSVMLAARTEADGQVSENRNHVKIAAVQINGYDKGDLPREDYDVVGKLLPYIDRAGKDDAQLVVFHLMCSLKFCIP